MTQVVAHRKSFHRDTRDTDTHIPLRGRGSRAWPGAPRARRTYTQGSGCTRRTACGARRGGWHEGATDTHGPSMEPCCVANPRGPAPLHPANRQARRARRAHRDDRRPHARSSEPRSCPPPRTRTFRVSAIEGQMSTLARQLLCMPVLHNNERVVLCGVHEDLILVRAQADV